MLKSVVQFEQGATSDRVDLTGSKFVIVSPFSNGTQFEMKKKR